MLREAWVASRERSLHRTRSARSSAPLLRSRSDTLPPLYLLRVFCRKAFGVFPPTQHPIQAALGDYVVLVPPGVPRARVPFDGPFILQVLQGIVVALAVWADAGAFRRLRKEQTASC